ncbi:hypothetical protein V6N11_079832 [Hibiscus sabdariffa]|uniref:Uncharacterized protein n=1 Tax=Hibiscus sabdariffa TaxID=183260 RepID=A0ABR2RWP7_9ROSI
MKATTCAIEVVHVSFTHAPSQDNALFVPFHHVPNQDNAPSIPVHHVPGQDNDPSIPIDHSRSAMPTESIVNWVVSKKQGLNGRFDKALPWKDKAADHELKEFIKESLKKMHKTDSSTLAIPKVALYFHGSACKS